MLAVVLEALLVAAGLDLLVTGAPHISGDSPARQGASALPAHPAGCQSAAFSVSRAALGSVSAW